MTDGSVVAASGAARPTAVSGAGLMLELIRNRSAASRGALEQLTGMRRSTVAHRVELLEACGLVVQTPGTVSTGGRPPRSLRFNPGAGVVLAAGLGDRRLRTVATDLACTPLGEIAEPVDAATEPEAALARIEEHFGRLVEEAERDPRDVRAIVLGLPVAISPPLAEGGERDGSRVRDALRERYPAPVIVENIAHLRALGEHWCHWRGAEHLLFVNMSTEIACGIVAGGDVVRGAQGVAGAIGHISLAGNDDLPCRCGGTGCLETVAGAGAIAARLSAQGVPVAGIGDLIQLVRRREPLAVRAVRDAGRRLGEVLAMIVELFNPHVIVVGGALAEVHEDLLAGARELIIRRASPRATRELPIVASRLGERAGVMGAAALGVERLLAPEAVEDAIAGTLGLNPAPR